MHYEVVRAAVPSDTLLIHGNVASNQWWHPSVESWAKRKEEEESGGSPWTGDLILAEWRGCGKSSGPQSEKDMDFSVLANDYLDLLDSLGVQKTNVVGHSAGGMIALHAMMAAPERFRKAVLLDPSPAEGLKVTPELQTSFVQMSRDREAVRLMLDGTIYQNEISSPFFEKLVDQACATHPLVWAHILQKLRAVNIEDKLSQIKNPTLVLHGEHDTVVPRAGSESLAELLPEGRFELLEHQGHSCNIENPDRFVAIAHRYLFW